MKKKDRLAFLCMVWVLIVGGTWVNSEAQSFLDLKVDEFVVDKATIEEALAKLHEYGIRVCLEKVPRPRGSEEKRVSLQLSEVSIRNILDEIVKSDPRYEWEYVTLPTGCDLVSVLPKGAKGDPEDLLNTKVAAFKVDDITIEEAISNIYDFCPELQQRIRYGGRAGSILRGIPMKGQRRVRKVSLLLENVTLREILNELICMSSNSGAGWLFEFIIDESYPSGGYHISRTF